MHAEQRDHNYATFKETYLKYRKVVAEWMVDVCEYFTLHPTTTHAAICYLDRLQPHEKFSRFEWQMIAISCILMASKYNECEDHVPDLSTLEDITQQAISNETVLQYELWALKRMGWKLNARTPICFLCSYLRAGIIFDDDVTVAASADSDNSEEEAIPQSVLVSEGGPELMERLDAKAGRLAKTITGMCILDSSFKHFAASDVAVAVVYSIRKELVKESWHVCLSSSSLGLGLPADPLASESVREICQMLSKMNILGGVLRPSSIEVPARGNNKGKDLQNESPIGVEDTAHYDVDDDDEENDKYSHVNSIGGSNAAGVSPDSKENRKPVVNAAY
jgi:hypothetical protein